MKPGLKPGDMSSLEYVVTEDRIVPRLYPELEEFRRGQPVFATGYMVGLLEAPCMKMLHHYLEGEERCVGTMVSIQHVKATLPGMELLVTGECTVVGDAYTEWDVVARDGLGEVVASGSHGRRIVDQGSFLRKARSRMSRINGHDLKRAV